MQVSQQQRGSSPTRIPFLALSIVSLAICAYYAAAHYLKWDWGNPGQPIGWLLSMLFLLLAFAPGPRRLAAAFRNAIGPRTAFFAFWLLFFTFSHLWNFGTAPWNGDSLFDESGWDLWFLKSQVIGHPFQPAWFHYPISRETLFHYYLLPFFHVFGFNVLSYQAALFVIWCTTFIFTLLLVDLLFGSTVVTAITALIFNFLPFAFIYTFVGYRYPMAVALCTISLYFLHKGFRTASSLRLALGGIAAGLCLASSISGKQYSLVLALFALIYAGLNWNTARRTVDARQIAIVLYGWLAASTPLLCYVAFNRESYTLYESSFFESFWQALRGNPSPNDITYYLDQFVNCFFSAPGNRFFIPEVLPIPLPYYCFLVPGFFLALRGKRYEIALLATIPVIGAFVAICFDNRLLLPIPFWIILMGFTFDALSRLKPRPGFRLLVWGAAAAIVGAGLAPSVRYIYDKTENPFSIRLYAQEEVAVSRFLRHVVAGVEPVNPPRLERDEFNRVEGVPDAAHETFICQKDAYSIIHLYLHDYDDAKILSFCDDVPFNLMDEQKVWRANRKSVLGLVPSGKGLKLVWERDATTNRIIETFRQLRSLGTEQSIALSFAGRERQFYVLTIDRENVRRFRERVGSLPAVL